MRQISGLISKSQIRALLWAYSQLAILSPGKNIDPANNSQRYEKSAMRVSFVFF